MAFDKDTRSSDVQRRLRAALEGERLPHAYLFVGTAGTGRLEAARWLAGLIFCGSARPGGEPCGDCSDCRLLQSQSHPDCEEIGVPEGKQALPIEAVRQAQARAGLKPLRGGRRVFVIRDADRMSLEAANCFLKTLEEPPGRCLFILIAAGLHQIPETIVSRCRIVRFPSVAPEELRERLAEGGAEPDRAHWLARRSWGSPGLAARLREIGLGDLNDEMVRRLGSLALEQNFELSDWLGERARQTAPSSSESREALEDILECVVLFYRDMALAATAGAAEAAPDLVNRAAAEMIGRLAAGRPAEQFLAQAELALEALERVGGNANRRLALDHMFTQLARRQAGPN